MESATISGLIFLKALFKLAICKLEDVMNFEILSLLMGVIICLLEKPLVVILILGFTFPESLIILCISSIFLKINWGNFFEFQNFLDFKS